MESITIAIIVSLSTLAGVYLGSRRSEPKQTTKEIVPQETNPIQELFNLDDDNDVRAFKDLQKALNWNGKAPDEE